MIPLCYLFSYCQSFPDFFHHQIVISVTISFPETSYVYYTRMLECLLLSTNMYKRITSVISTRKEKYMYDENLIPKEQKGCYRGSNVSKDKLLISKAILQKCKRRKKLSMAWVDYRKVFNRAPHSWIIKLGLIIKLYHLLRRLWLTGKHACAYTQKIN